MAPAQGWQGNSWSVPNFLSRVTSSGATVKSWICVCVFFYYCYELFFSFILLNFLFIYLCIYFLLSLLCLFVLLVFVLWLLIFFLLAYFVCVCVCVCVCMCAFKFVLCVYVCALLVLSLLFPLCLFYGQFSYHCGSG